ncbi:MAG: hypothetical protein ACKOOA_04525 [Sediminibacterium sp.]
MKKQFINMTHYSIALLATIISFSSCQKDFSGALPNPNNNTSATNNTSGAIAIALNGSSQSNGSSTDSVYVVHECEKGLKRDSIAFTSLPAAVQTYLSSTYSGFTPLKAFVIKDTLGNVKGYIAIIRFNDKPVALEFKADGTFKKVLEQREKGDLSGSGWHLGGLFEDRDGKCKDTVALNDIPQGIRAYMTSNYPGDTLMKAFKTKGGVFVLISKNNGAFATLFNKNGGFEKRVALPAKDGELVNIAQSGLPAVILNFLSATFPNYVFNKADVLKSNGTVLGYLVLINANNTRYAVAFDAAGKFLAKKVIH